MQKNKKYTIGIVTGARSEYGLLKPVYQALHEHGNRVRWYVTGMHLLPEFGQSWKQLEKDGMKIAARVPMYDKGASATATGAQGLASAMRKDKLDFVLLLGDRAEMLAGAIAAFDLHIPIIHLHGGDITNSGHQDEVIRPTLTKLSHLHFAASKESARRILKLGEEPWRVYVAGSSALDAVYAQTLLSSATLRHMLQIPTRRYAVVLFHPNDKEAAIAGLHLRTILQTLRRDPELSLVLIYPNNDRGSDRVIAEIEKWRGTAGVSIFKTLPQKEYLSALRHAEFLIGNSSSSIYECSAMKVPAIIVGRRNRGREHGANVVFAEPTTSSITVALRRIASPVFSRAMKKDAQRFGRGDAGVRIATALAKLSVSKERLLQKLPTY
jgi:GDP/UDP-N,N'-diacetylbacillosamine 2-epimerase (hydrolysing)